MAPKPRRRTGRSPPSRKVPLRAAGRASTPASPAGWVLIEGVMRSVTPAEHRRFRASGFNMRRRRHTQAFRPSRALRRAVCCPARGMKRAGFTLIELMTVVAIVGLLAMIAIPKLADLRGRAQVAAMKSDLRNLVTLEENYFAQHLQYATAADLAGTYAVTAGNSM